MTLPRYFASGAGGESSRSAGGQLEQPCEVNSSTMAIRPLSPEPPRGARTIRIGSSNRILDVGFMKLSPAKIRIGCPNGLPFEASPPGPFHCVERGNGLGTYFKSCSPETIPA